MKILAVMSDLFFSVKINDAAKRIGMSVEFVKDKNLAMEKIAAKPPIAIFDLNCTDAAPLELLRAIKSNPETAGIKTIAFVSHVQSDLKREAGATGCDVVVARSVFAQNLEKILGQFSSKPEPEANSV